MDEKPGTIPRLGAAIRGEWLLDRDWLTVNHGSFGATPRIVLEAQETWRRRMEEQPSRFMRRILPEALRKAADRLAGFLGADGRDLAFVENATVGCNAVLFSLSFDPGDEILALSHVYGAVRNAARHVAARSGARLIEAELPFPRPSPEAMLEAVKQALSPRTRLAVIDHITSSSALLLPLSAIIGACHERGVPVLVDGAHGPGQVAIDLTALDADWYVGNCHKWLMAPKGCGFLWARRDRQAQLHPVTISHGYGTGFLAEFDWTGTRDASAFLAVDAALDFHFRLGGAGLRARNSALAAEATALLTRRLGSEAGGDASTMAAMGLARLPTAGPATAEHVERLRERLLDAGTDAPLHRHGDTVWLRLSAQAYNELADYERLAEIVTAALHDQRHAT